MTKIKWSWHFFEILGKYNSSFRWSKLPNLQMHRKLGKTYTQPAIGVIGVPPGPPGGVPNAKPSIKASSFFCPVQGCVYKHLSAPGTYIRENISFSRRSSLLGSLPQLSARVTLYDSSVYGNWLSPKGIAKVSGILEGSGFYIKSIYERMRKGPKRKD